jgi:Fe-S cluster assembly protein SufB
MQPSSQPLDQGISTDSYAYIAKPGLSKHIVQEISGAKKEPSWMLDKRLAALEIFLKQSMPTWGGDLSAINFDDYYYYLKPTDGEVKTWADVPQDIKNTFDRLKIPEAEKEVLGGVKAQFDSEVIYGSLMKPLEKQGVIFTSMDEAIQKYPDIVKQYFGKLISAADNKFASLNTAVWSGGSFVYIPAGVEVAMPLQAYFRLNAPRAGQFERTLIIAEAGSKVHYVEGCTAPAYSAASLHAAVVEIFVKPGATVQYTTVQNWYKSVYNLVTKRAYVETEGKMYWTDCNLGSKLTMKYPGFILAGKYAQGETLSMALAGANQHQDTGSKAIHLAPYTSSTITSKSISKQGGRTSYRGLVQVNPNAHHVKSRVVCDALILDADSRSDTYPTNKIYNAQATLEHEASVSKVSEAQLFYLMTRGLSEADAAKTIVNGFVAPLIKKLPLEYAVEMNRLIDMEMEGSVG